MTEARILRQTPLKTFPVPGEEKTIVAVTYQVGARAPRTVWIDEEKLTDANIAAAIRADQEVAEKERAATKTVTF